MNSIQDAGPNAKATILIVEDHDSVRLLLREWLSPVFPDCRFLEARSGEEAVTLAFGEAPDIVLMDIGLGQMSGIEATRRITTEVPQVEVVMLSIHEDPDYRESASLAGASAYVPKREMHHRLIPVLAALLSYRKDKGLDQHLPKKGPGNGLG